jgi:hypothetical protein
MSKNVVILKVQSDGQGGDPLTGCHSGQGEGRKTTSIVYSFKQTRIIERARAASSFLSLLRRLIWILRPSRPDPAQQRIPSDPPRQRAGQRRRTLSSKEGNRARWRGRASNPVGDGIRSRADSTPAAFRQLSPVSKTGSFFAALLRNAVARQHTMSRKCLRFQGETGATVQFFDGRCF